MSQVPTNVLPRTKTAPLPVVDLHDVVPERPAPRTGQLLLDIARPRVVALVVFTGLPALFLGKDVWPTFGQAFWVLLGTGLAGASSSAFNAWYERDVDAHMARTKRRPLPAAALVPSVVLAYAVLLTIVSTWILAWIGGFGAAAIGLATTAFYVGVYTMWLKPSTPQNIVIGGAAGSTAPLIASVAMDGTISPGAWILFAIVFLWTPPHFWAVAIFRKAEYEAAGFPMMPSVVGDQATRRQSLMYTLLMLPVTVLPVALGHLSMAYGGAAVLLGLWFLYAVVDSMRQQRPVVDYRVFKISIVYLTLLFVAMFLDLALF